MVHKETLWPLSPDDGDHCTSLGDCLQGWLVRFLTQTYSQKQAEAGEEVGVSQGEAWRVAMEEGAKAGARQVSPALAEHMPCRATLV